MRWRREPDESRVGIERFAARWPVPERIEANREATGEVRVWIRKVWIRSCEEVSRDHLLELLLLALLLLQVHGNGESKGVERTDLSHEADRLAEREIWSCGGRVAGQVGWWMCALARTLKSNVRHGCLCHQEGGRGSADAMGDRGTTHADDNTWNLARNCSRVDMVSESGEIGRKDKMMIVCGP